MKNVLFVGVLISVLTACSSPRSLSQSENDEFFHQLEKALSVVFFDHEKIEYSQKEDPSFDRQEILEKIGEFKASSKGSAVIEVRKDGNIYYAEYNLISRRLIKLNSRRPPDIRVGFGPEKSMLFGPRELKFQFSRSSQELVHVTSFEI